MPACVASIRSCHRTHGGQCAYLDLLSAVDVCSLEGEDSVQRYLKQHGYLEACAPRYRAVFGANVDCAAVLSRLQCQGKDS